MSDAIEAKRTEELFGSAIGAGRRQTDRVFAALMAVQWVAGIVAAVVISPRTWTGTQSAVHVHVLAAVVGGGVLASLPIVLALRRPGEALTRHVIAVAQMLFSALFIHLTGGRIETHFHVFGSLAFLAFYRDWRVLVPATVVIAADHLVRGVFWPQSVFGVLSAAPWRAFEHAGWVLFEDLFLAFSCVRGVREMRLIAQRQAQLECTNAEIEERIRQRTCELQEKTAALEDEIRERKLIEAHLVQAQKLESIGQLAAGIAHEINTPAQFVSDNVRFLRDQFGHLLTVVNHYAAELDPNAQQKTWEQRIEEARTTLQRLDYDFLRTEIPQALEQSLEGLARVTTIVRAMKEFSHPGSSTKQFADVNKAIESTITVCRNRWKIVADVETDFAPDLPPVPCHVAEFNQVILNLLVNSTDSIADCARKNPSHERGRVVVSTRVDGDSVEIRVRDNGEGIAPEIRSRIFDPFFTTKQVGQGTGQGLTISRSVIVDKHGGTIRCESTPGEGCTFIVRLPLEQRGVEESALADAEGADAITETRLEGAMTCS